MSLTGGQRLGPYEILAPLGAGGMGEVYRARDVRLDREVAIKVLPSELAEDPTFRTRFDREARSASALSHPNIAHIYDVGEDDGHHFIAMEYVEGQDLHNLVKPGPLETDRTIDYAIQMVSALEAAHTKGIVHRDIKSANVMVSSADQVKVLDFGLARREPSGDQSAESMLTATLDTQPGLILGTVPYMSPEQALGKPIDARSDLFSVGIVLYEMATGRLPFKGETAMDTIDKICHATPEQIDSLNRSIPPELERIVRKCLEKNRDSRYATARDLLVDLRNLKRDSQTLPAIPKASSAKTDHQWFLVGMGIVAVIAVVTAFFVWRAAARGPIDSLAVIPFENESGNEEVEYLSDGISESLINALSEIPDLKVISRRSAFEFKGSGEDVGEIGRKLGVRAVLVGRMTQRGDELTISAELVDVEDDGQIWGDRFNRKMTDVLSVEQELTSTIVRKLRLEITGEETERLAHRGTDDPMAYQLFLKGVHFMEGTADEMLRGQAALEEAVQIDPDYAEAHAALANTHMLALLHGTENREEALRATRASMDRALAADPDLAGTYIVAGNIKLLYDWDLPGAEAAFARAIELSPSMSVAHQEYAWCMWAKGDSKQALISSQKALDLDPLSRGPMHHIGYTQMASRHFDEAIVSFQNVLEVYPEWIWGHVKLGVAYAHNGMPDQALAQAAEAESLIAKGGETPLLRGWLGVLYARSGEEAKAREALAALEEMADFNAEFTIDMAALYLALGNRESSLDCLERGYAARAPWFVFVPEYFFFDDLRGDPRFEALMDEFKAYTADLQSTM